MYDATGCTDDDALPGNRSYDEWYDYWRNMFSKITVKVLTGTVDQTDLVFYKRLFTGHRRI